ncbi:ABC transporter permease [Nocardia crassostreae]|uniref:ABC transporter permease n=1 Tax=Nocardia crassostreae TaxID=53428 RepID=UPI0008315341|nr:ABC transporter permease subunit [Nocardia crassostreae]
MIREPVRQLPWLRAIPAVAVALPALIGPLVASRDTEAASGLPFAEPDSSAWLGTDRLGRDVLTQLLHGGWGLIALAGVIAILVAGPSSVLGTLAALRPRAGVFVERGADLAVLLPPMLGVLLVMLSWPESGVFGVITVAVLFGIPYCTRVFAAAAAGVAATGYVEAARVSGESTAHIVFREMLPNMRELCWTQLGLRFVTGMYIASAAAFLQLPGTLDAANWAIMVRENASGMLLNPWAALAPSLAIAVVAVGVNISATAFGRIAPPGADGPKGPRT